MLVLFLWFIIILLALILTYPIRIAVKGGVYGREGVFSVSFYISSVKLFSLHKQFEREVTKGILKNDKKAKERRLKLNANAIKELIKRGTYLVDKLSLGFWGDVEPSQIAIINPFLGNFLDKSIYFGRGEERITFDLMIRFTVIQIIIDFFAILNVQREGK